METAQQLQISLILRESPKAMLIGICSAWLLAAGMWEGNRQFDYALRSFGWATVITCLLARGAWIARSTRGNSSDDGLHAQSRRVQRNAGALALLWGSSSFAMSRGSDIEHQMLLVAAIALITMGGAMGRAVHVPRVQLFVMITTVVFSMGLLSTPGRFQLFIGLGYLLFGTVIALFCRAQDNTVHREREMNLAIEQLLHQAQEASARAETARLEAERANAAKTRFLATASHDLRQPMHSIGLLVGLIFNRATDPEVKHLSLRTTEAVHRMERLFGSLLDISKLDAGVVKPKFETLEMNALLSSVDRVFAAQAEARSVKLRVRPSRWRVRTDSVLLERIVNNLVANALAYCQVGGVLVGCRRRGDSVLLQVWDTGPGIALEHQEAIFEEFYRVAESEGSGSTLRGEDRGLGLGLSIVKRSAEVLQHPVRLQSVPGRGSRFEVQIPLALLPVTPSAPHMETSESGLAGCFIVVVDDDELNREAMSELFKQQGCLVVAAGGTEVLMGEFAQHLRSPDLIVSDYHLANGSTAEELLSQIRERCEENIPALIVSSDSGGACAIWAAQAASELLVKPASSERLLEAAARALTARPTFSPPPEPVAEDERQVSADDATYELRSSP